MDQKSCVLKHGCVSTSGRAATKRDVQGTHTAHKRLGAAPTTPLSPPEWWRKQVHHSSGHARADRPTVFYTYACRYRQMERENYCAHKLKLWSRQFKKQTRKFRAKKTACVSQADERRRRITHPFTRGSETPARARRDPASLHLFSATVCLRPHATGFVKPPFNNFLSQSITKLHIVIYSTN